MIPVTIRNGILIRIIHTSKQIFMENSQNQQNHLQSKYLTYRNEYCDEKSTKTLRKIQNQQSFGLRKSKNMDMKSWQKSQKQKWLLFIVKLSMENKYLNVQEELLSSDHTEKYYIEMAKQISTKIAKECEKYTVQVITKYYQKQNKFQNLIQWAINLLARDQGEEIRKCIDEYTSNLQKKSEYMQGIQDLQRELQAAEMEGAKE